MQMRLDTCCIIPVHRNGILFSLVHYFLVRDPFIYIYIYIPSVRGKRMDPLLCMH